MSYYALGIDLGGTNIKAALVERHHGLTHVIERATEADQGARHVLERILETVRELMTAATGEVQGIGMGAPGSVNWERTRITESPNIPGWDEVDVASVFRERLSRHLPVIVENDANAAALGSAHYGAGQPYDHFIMVTLGTGVGGAIIYQNKIFRGQTGGAGEIGHMTIDYEGPVARSGVAGAIEAYLGQHFLSRHARDRLWAREDSLLHKMMAHDRPVTPKLLFEAAQQGDQAARDILAWAGHKLGCVLGAAINLLDIRTVIVGGGVAGAGDYILGPARATLHHFIKPGLQEGTRIIPETLGNEAGMLGAAHLVFEYLDDHAATSTPS